MNFVEAIGWTVIGLTIFVALLAWGARIYHEISEGDTLGPGVGTLLYFGIPILVVTPFALSGFLG